MVHLHFDSVSDLLAKATDSRTGPTRLVENYGSGFDPSKSYFTGRGDIRTWQDVLRACNTVWQDGLDEVQGMLHTLEQELYDLKPPQEMRRRRRFSEDSGDDVDNDRLRGGQSDYWVETRRTNVIAPKRIVIVSDMGTRGTVAAKDVLWRGALSIAATDILEKYGYQVDLIAANHNSGFKKNKEIIYITYFLKRVGDAMDISSITNFVSGWFYRTANFQSRSIPRHFILDSTYGITLKISKEDKPIQDVCGNAKIVIVDNVWSLKDAIAKVREIVLAASETEQD